ncbi:MAG TPA: S8 family serine peptidase [Candidatus Competibacteraceae bacterium]|nr:S8 family serine peptidase [Candidatus Competibacteraceae bacterium]
MSYYRLSMIALWSRLLAIVLALAAFTSWAGTSAIERLLPEDRAVINQGHAVEVIIEFDQTEAASLAAERQRRAGLRYDDAVSLAERARSYRRQKDQVLAALAAEPLIVQNNYDYLPMLAVRLRSPVTLKALLRQPEVKAVHSNVKLRYMLAQSLPLIQQPETAAQGGTGAGATVAVLDTGVDYTRVAFGSCTAPGGSCRVIHAQDFAPDDGAQDDDGHGTNVAGIVLGVAPGARIAALDVFRNDGFAYSSDIIEAINWVIANRDIYNIVAINLSLGGNRYDVPCPSDVFATPIANARVAGILTTIASGNEGDKNAIDSPACVPAAISVGAVYDASQGDISWSNCTDRNIQADQVACFSNSADFLTLLAPGALITAAGATMGGTSQATPHVAGAIAVLRAAYPSESLDAIIARLSNNGVLVTDTNGVVKPRIDLLSAYTANRAAYALMVNKAGTGSGTVSSTPAGIDCGSQCRASFAAGTAVHLIAAPNAGSTFTGWSGACSGTSACTVIMDAAYSVTGTFNTASNLSLGEALDNTTLNWRTTGAAGWQAVQLNNRDAARSGVISDNQVSELHTSITGPGTLTFQWRVSSEPGYDYLEFQIDGVLQFRISGASERQTRTITIGAGTHEVRWVYRKDSAISVGEDAGWVDAVIFTPTQSSLPNLTVTQAGSPANGTPGGMIEVSATVANQGDATAGSFSLAFLLSDDPVITFSDTTTGWGCSFDSLAGGAAKTCSGEISIPATLEPGVYYLGAYADLNGEVTESDETNNGQAADNQIVIASSVSSLIVTRVGSGAGKVSSNPAGIDCGSQCNMNFATGTVVTLTAIPNFGSTFAGWSGGCTGTRRRCRMALNAARNVTATFNATAGLKAFPPNGILPRD